jgi:hypothetical protein
VPLKAFLLEIGEETRKLGRQAVAWLMSRKGKLVRKDEEYLVPSMFDLSGAEGPDLEINALASDDVIELPERRLRRASLTDRRFFKAAGAAAVAAVAALLVISLTPRAQRGGSMVSPGKAAESSGALATPATLKPSAIIERGGSRSSPASSLLAAKQVMRSDSGAEDTVVRLRRSQSASKHGDSHSQIKRYSDLD